MQTQRKQITSAFIAVWMLIVTTFFTSCYKYTYEDGLEESIESPEITSFILKKNNNPQLKQDIVGSIDQDNNILIKIDYSVNTVNFKPTIVTRNCQSIIPKSLEVIDASKVNTYAASNGKQTKEYKVFFDLLDSNPKMIRLTVNGTPAYLNKETNVYHVPIDRAKWDMPLEFDLQGVGIKELLINDEVVNFATETVVGLAFGKEHSLKIKNADIETTYGLILNALPIMSIRSDVEIEGVNSKYAQTRTPVLISLYDPTDDGKYSIIDNFAGMRSRGLSSFSRPKKSYAIEFQDPVTYEEVDAHLFGLRKDGDWIMDSGTKNVIRIANRIASDLWIDIHTLGYAASEPKAKAGSRGVLTEIYFNDKYVGIYNICERIDRKQLNIDKTNGYLYKGEGYDSHILFEGYSPDKFPNKGDERWKDNGYGYQAEYPTPAIWDPIIDFTKFVCDSNDKELAQGIESRLELKNLADFIIFLSVVGATDNVGANLYLGLYNKIGTNPYDKRLFYIPWDLDATFGRFATKLIKINAGFIPGVTKGHTRKNQLFIRLVEMEDPRFRIILKNRWNELKDNLCSPPLIINRFRDYQELLEKCGAYNREFDKWENQNVVAGEEPMQPLNEEILYIESWLEEQYTYFDNFVQGLSVE